MAEFGTTLGARLAEALYTEAMLLADETRSYLDGQGQADRAALEPRDRVLFACETLNATTRLMQVIAWLLVRRAPEGGAGQRLGTAPSADRARVERLPAQARQLIDAGLDLYMRAGRLESGALEQLGESPARSLLLRLERAF
jgi:regulator of CtrA degradation